MRTLHCNANRFNLSSNQFAIFVVSRLNDRSNGSP